MSTERKPINPYTIPKQTLKEIHSSAVLNMIESLRKAKVPQKDIERQIQNTEKQTNPIAIMIFASTAAQAINSK